jgi:hypothetical protein
VWYPATAEKGPVSGQALRNRGIKVCFYGELSSTMVEISSSTKGSTAVGRIPSRRTT